MMTAHPSLYIAGSSAAFSPGGLRPLTTTPPVGPFVGRHGIALGLETGSENCVGNPSFEVDAAGWVPGSGKVLARTNAHAASGAASLQVTHNSSGTTYCSYDLTLVAPGPHVVSAWIWLPSDWDGTGPAITMSSFTGSTLVDFSRRAANPAIREAWQRVWEVRSIAAGDLVGNTGFFESGTLPSSGRSFFVDAVQVEPGTYPTSYLDGSLGDGYAWTGTPHASPSTRAAGRLEVEGAWLDPRCGGLAAFVRPSWGAAEAGEHVVLHREGAGGGVRIAFEAGTWRLTSTRGALTSSVEVAASHAWGDDVLVTAGWTPRTLVLQVDGVRALAPRVGGWPTLGDARRLEVGRRQDVASGWFDGALGPLTLFDRPLAPRAVDALRRLHRPIGWTDDVPSDVDLPAS